MKRCYLTLALLASLLTASSAVAQDCTTEWTNAAGGAYNDATNWSDGLPDADDDACITLAGTYTVTNTSGIIVNTLQFGGETGAQTLETSRGMTFGASGTIGANGVLAWTAGYLESGTLTNEGLVRLTTTSNRGVRGVGALFRNEGTVTWTDDGSFYVYNDGRAENASVWDVQGGGDLLGYSSARGDFVNEAGATLRKTTATAETRIAGRAFFFENAGTVDVQSGTISVQSSTTLTDATFTVAEDAILQFTGNSVVTFAGTTMGSPAGQLILASAFAADEDDGATWNVGGTGVEWTADYLESGTLTNAGLVRLTTTGSRGVRGVGALFRNEGTVTWTDDGSFYVYNDGRAENASVWDVQGGGDFFSSGSVRGDFVNEASATLRKTTATAETRIAGSVFFFENAGTVDVQSGTMTVQSPSTLTDATFAVAEDAILQFTGNAPVLFAGTTTGSPTGQLILASPFEADEDDGAAWNVGGTGIEWTANYLESGTMTNAGLVRLTTGNSSRGVRNVGTVFRNEGTVEWTGDGRFYVYEDGRAENAALWDVQGGGRLLGYSNVRGDFVNETGATLRKSSGDETFISGGTLFFENAGTVDVQSGTVNVDRPFDHQSGALVAGDGIFDVVNATLTLDGDVAPGTSAPGILTWTRDYAPASGSALVIEVQDESGAGAGHDQLQVSRNVDVTQSTLRVEGSGNACADAAPCEYVILAFEGSFSGPFAVEELPSNAVVIYPDDEGGVAGQVVLRAKGPLPVELASFTAALDGEAAVLQWQTASETNNAGFDVEHRAPGTDAFAEVAFVEGHGTTTEAQRYTHRLESLIPGTHTFRLKQVDLDGAFEYSAEVEVNVEMTEAFRLEAAAPNPFRSQATLRFAVREAQTVRVDLYDVLGRRTRVLFEGEVPAGEMQRVLLEGSGLSSGLYFVRLAGQSFAETQRVTLVQ